MNEFKMFGAGIPPEETPKTVNPGEKKEEKSGIEDEIRATKAKFPELVKSFSGDVKDVDRILEESGKLSGKLEDLERQKNSERIRENEEYIRAKKERELETIAFNISKEMHILSEKQSSKNNNRPDDSGSNESMERIKKRVENLSVEEHFLNGKGSPWVRSWREKSWDKIQESEEDARTETGKEKFRKDREEAWCNLKDLENSNLEEFEKALEEAESEIKTGEENFKKMKDNWQSLPADQKDNALEKTREINRWKLRYENLRLAIARKRVMGS